MSNGKSWWLDISDKEKWKEKARHIPLELFWDKLKRVLEALKIQFINETDKAAILWLQSLRNPFHLQVKPLHYKIIINSKDFCHMHKLELQQAVFKIQFF